MVNILIIFAVIYIVGKLILVCDDVFSKQKPWFEGPDIPYNPNRSWIGKEMAFMFPTFYRWFT